MKRKPTPVFTEPPPVYADPCTFINEGCPDDFCRLEYNHGGGHLLQTMPYDLPIEERIPRRPGDCAPQGTDLYDVALLGWQRQRRSLR